MRERPVIVEKLQRIQKISVARLGRIGKQHALVPELADADTGNAGVELVGIDHIGAARRREIAFRGVVRAFPVFEPGE